MEILFRIKILYRKLLSEEARNNLYHRVPKGVRQIWDHFERSIQTQHLDFLKISEKDVEYAIRLFWLKEPTQDEISNHFFHADRFNFNLNQLTHELMHNSNAKLSKPPLQNTLVPNELDEIGYYCYRLILKREPTRKEKQNLAHQLKTKPITFGELRSSFINGAEYRELREREHKPYLVELEKFKIFVRLEDYFTSGPIVRYKAYEPYNSRLMAEHVKPGDYVLDVGANVGYHALHMASIVGETGKVFAFEPHVENCELIDLSVKANEFSNFKLFPHAAGEEESELNLMVVGNHTNARLLTNSEFDDPNSDKYRVRVVKIDDVLADMPRLDFAKIDVEGAEPLVVRGMSELINRYKPILFFEFFPDFIRMTSQVEPEKFLQEVIDFGYQLHITTREDELIAAQDAAHAMQLFNANAIQLVDILAIPKDK